MPPGQNSAGTLTLACLLASLLLGLAGCGPTQTGGDTPTTDLTADDLLASFLAAYREAPAYHDHAQLHHSFRVNGKPQELSADLEVALQRPNRLSVRAYQVRLVCNGEQLLAGIADESTNHLDSQVLALPAPERLTLENVLADPLLRDTLSSGLGSLPLQLALLLDPEQAAAGPWRRASKQLLPAEAIEGRECLGLQIAGPEGDLRFWIDRETYVLRRLEYPIGGLAENLTQRFSAEGPVTEVKLHADFTGAAFAPPDAEAFEFPLTEEARLVQRFVLPPLPLPSDLFGQSPPPFTLTNAAGEPLTSEMLAGRPTVLCWFEDHPASRALLERLKTAVEPLEADAVNVLAVSPAPGSVSTAQVAKVLEGWNLGMPLARDPEAIGASVFSIAEAPTLVFLDAQGAVQLYQSGATAGLLEQLPKLIERLTKGDDLAAEILAEAKRERELYEQNVEAASAGGKVTELPLPETRVEPRSEPQSLKLSPLWNNTEVEAPGNILVVEGEAGSRIFVVDAGSKIAELNAAGEVAAVHAPELPEAGRISMLRTAVDGEGNRWFAASAVQGRQAYLFDDSWNLKVSYPNADQSHDGIRDIQLADLAADGRPELYLGFWNLVGVQRVALEGGRMWTHRLPVVVSLCTSAPAEEERQLLVTTDLGGILPFSAEGEESKEIRVPRHGIHQLYGAKFDSGLQPATAYCGFSYTAAGNLKAIGLTPEFEEAWMVELPPGLYSGGLEPVVSGSWLPGDSGQWVIVAPGGTIYIVSHDGGFSDGFHYGARVSGVAVTRLEDRPVLLVAAGSEVTALHVERAEP